MVSLDDYSWHVYTTPLIAILRPVTLLDGRRVRFGVIMRRRSGSVWQYRDMTKDESFDYMAESSF